MKNSVRGRSVVVLFSACAAAGGLQAAAEAPPAVQIGSRRELFVDRYLIDRLEGTRLKLHGPRPAEIAVKFDRPWEGRYCGYVTVIKDGDAYRMYYRGLPVAKHSQNVEVTCYAESSDGVHWAKPNIGLCEVGGSRDNNVILCRSGEACHNFSPFVDTKPGTPSAQRHKALAGTGKGLFGFVSADGIRFQKMRDQPLITKGAFDSQNVAFFSASEECYVCYFRTWSQEGTRGFRTISRTTSKDFVNWTDPVEMGFGDTPREHLYTNQTHPYFRAPHLYVAVAARFMPGRKVLTDAQAEALQVEHQYRGDCSDTVLMTSRGGNWYDRTFMEGFVRPGIGLGNWSSRTNYPALGVVPTGAEEMSLYVQRDYGQPSHHLCRYTLRLDGFASVNAPYAGGEMVTRPLVFAGRELVINYSTSAAGSVRVELQDASGKALPGYRLEDAAEIIGDEIERVVSFKGGSDLSSLAGRPIRVRFVIKDADLYSLCFR